MTTADLDLTGFYADSTESGLTVATSEDLDSTVLAGIVYINQAKVTVAEDNKTFTASKDTYVDVGDDATITYTEAVLEAEAPALAADAVRLAKVVTDGTTVASVVDLRTLTVANVFAYGEVDINGGSTMDIYNTSGTTVYVRHGAASTSRGVPLAPSTAMTVVETVYAKPSGLGTFLVITK